MSEPAASIRLDKWLWFARFFKTRSLAARVVTAGAVRVNGIRASKPSAVVREGDVLTFSQRNRVRIVEILAPGARRGPAPEAQTLYKDRSPPPPVSADAQSGAPQRDAGGRPTKKDRRALENLRGAP